MRPHIKPPAPLALVVVLLIALAGLPPAGAAATAARQDSYWVEVWPSSSSPTVLELVRFNGGISDPYAPPVAARAWDFGDGAVSDEVEPVHRYLTAGQRTVTLTLTLEDGTSWTGSTWLDVRLIPIRVSPDQYEYSVYDTLAFDVDFYSFFSALSCSWDFGDGSPAVVAQCGSWGTPARHRYAADGVYQVTATMSTADGLTALSERSLLVSTHDVAVARLQVPNSARVGQSRELTLSIANQRQDEEQVQVELYVSDPTAGSYPYPGYDAGFRFVSRGEYYVPVRPRNRTTEVTLSYTFLPQDADVGTVNFMVRLSIVGHRDAQPANDTFVSLPVVVR